MSHLVEDFVYKNTCPVCDSNNVVTLINIESVPVLCNVFFTTKEQALNVTRGNIKLTSCSDCSHIFNSTFNASLMNYSEDYDCSLHYSSTFQSYANKITEELIKKYSLRNKTIIEIACGKGDFLGVLCKKGGNKGIGFDPSYEPGRLDEELIENVTFIKDYYTDKYKDVDADLICCRHALEHIEKPVEFLKTIRQALLHRIDTVLFFEMPNSLYIVRDLSIWDVIYEHCGYFSKQSLSLAFLLSGFIPQKINYVFGNQYLTIEALTKPIDNIIGSLGSDLELSHEIIEPSHSESINSICEDEQGVSDYLSIFSSKYTEKISHWKQFFVCSKSKGERVVVWGAGSKGVSFLNFLDISDEITAIVDINPHKQGKFIPGTGHKVISPKCLNDSPPDVVVVMNPLYLQEIENLLLKQGISAKIVCDII